MIAHISDDESSREESVAEHTKKVTFLCDEKGKPCGLSFPLLADAGGMRVNAKSRPEAIPQKQAVLTVAVLRAAAK